VSRASLYCASSSLIRAASSNSAIVLACFDISIRKAGGKQAVECDLPLNQVPDDYLTFTPNLNRELLREHLEKGKLPAVLKFSTRLREKSNYISIR